MRPSSTSDGYNSLGYETNVVWEEDIDRLDYVRQAFVTCSRRRGPIRWSGAGRRVGYVELAPDAPNIGMPMSFDRRMFFLKEHDRDSGDPVYATGAPSEAVDPRTVEPGVDAELTERAWGRPFEDEEG